MVFFLDLFMKVFLGLSFFFSILYFFILFFIIWRNSHEIFLSGLEKHLFNNFLLIFLSFSFPKGNIMRNDKEHGDRGVGAAYNLLGVRILPVPLGRSLLAIRSSPKLHIRTNEVVEFHPPRFFFIGEFK
jgi:hypothetical protein